MSARYFRSSAAVYENVRASLDAAWGYPNGHTQTAIPTAAELPSDEQGRVYLSVSAEFCNFVLPSQMLPKLLSRGDVEEIDEEAYRSLLPPDPAMGA